eukprot:TRINITY_DN9051_c0_g1_i7.p2 TRINITY_DN9051_c0_g1~~TRINITY_DN9051_c0_g1_i7.p2  ORF type:complete len:149 (-),score=5.98 TRINITY_DN9051_c0_g1_i7:226-672(-)
MKLQRIATQNQGELVMSVVDSCCGVEEDGDTHVLRVFIRGAGEDEVEEEEVVEALEDFNGGVGVEEDVFACRERLYWERPEFIFCSLVKRFFTYRDTAAQILSAVMGFFLLKAFLSSDLLITRAGRALDLRASVIGLDWRFVNLGIFL